MDAGEYVRCQFAAIRRIAHGVSGDLTDDQLSWRPPGTMNTIGTTLIHCLGSQDRFIQEAAQGRPRIWETGGWAGIIGLENPPGRGGNWDDANSRAFSVASVLAYAKAVGAATDAYLETLKPEELDRRVMFGGTERPPAEVLALIAEHTAHHMGEISALKGILGAKGLPM